MPKGDKNILKADPEDGTTPVSNTLLVAVALSNLSGLETRAMLYLWRQTYGWEAEKWEAEKKKRRKEWTISLREWADALNTCKPNAHKVLKSLENKHVIKVKHFAKGKSNSYATNTLISEWSCVDKERLAKRLKVGSQMANMGVGQMANTVLVKLPTPQDTNSASPKESNKENIKEIYIKEKGPATPSETALLTEIHKIPEWIPEDDDLLWLRQLCEDFPALTPALIKACRDYHSSSKKVQKGPWKNRLRQWLEHDIKFKEEKGGEPGGAVSGDFESWKQLAGEPEG